MRSSPRLSKTLFSALLVLLVFAPPAEGGLKGKVKKKVYHSPAENFTISLPKAYPRGRMKVTDHFEGKEPLIMGGVYFSDDSGSVKGILYAASPEDLLERLGGLAGWLQKITLPTWFLPEFPDARVLREEAATFRGLEAYLALVELPEGSGAIDMKAKRRLDARRGLVIFERSPYVYTLVIETVTVWSLPGIDVQEVGEDWTNFSESLGSLYDTIHFVD
jgi:hypothetical protein